MIGIEEIKVKEIFGKIEKKYVIYGFERIEWMWRRSEKRGGGKEDGRKSEN